MSSSIPSKENCFGIKFPQIAEEWHKTKNYNLTPLDVCCYSDKKVWWICSNNHEWLASINSRRKAVGCPHCQQIMLTDGEFCDSVPEAIKYLEYKNKGLKFKHNEKYHEDLGACRYDFYFYDENRYVEVTSFDKKTFIKLPGFYFGYLRNIVKKRDFVQDVLGAKFEFIQFTPTKEQIALVRENMK